MNSAYSHLILTHVPVLGTIFGLFLLGLAFVKRSDELKRTSLLVFLLSGLIAVPTYLTGNSAASFIPDIHSDLNDQHAEVAILALTAAILLALVSAVGMICFRGARTVPKWFVGLSVVLAAITFATMAWTANLGAKIRHPEIGTSAFVNVGKLDRSHRAPSR